MTVPNTTNKITYAGDGATTAFTFAFPYIAPAAIFVIVTDSLGNITLIPSAQYTLVVNAPIAPNPTGIGGTVTYPLSGSPLPVGSSITIYRAAPAQQGTSLANQGTLYQSVIESMIDYVTMLQQQNAEYITRALAVPPTDPNPPFIPSVAARANKFLGFDSMGNPIASTGTGGGGGVANITVGSTTITGGVSGNFFYNNAGLFGEQTPTQLTASLNAFTSTLKGLAPASGGGTTNFLRADGTWAAPSGSVGVSSLNALTGALTLVAGTGISVTPAGANITIASTTPSLLAGRVAADQNFTSTTVLANVPGLSVTLTAGRTYSFQVEISWQAQPAGGLQLSVAGSGGLTATNIIFDGWIVDGAANGIKGDAQATALGIAVASALPTLNQGHAVISGTITVNAGGTLNVQAAQNTSNVLPTIIKRGSRMLVYDVT